MKKKRIKDMPEWRSIINVGGFALILAFWSGIINRTCDLRAVPEKLAPIIKDLSEEMLVLATLAFAMLAAFAEHDEAKKEVAWIQKTTWPFMTGWMMGLIYLVLLVFSSPAWPLRLFLLR